MSFSLRAAAAVAVLSTAAVPLAAQTGLTIYNDGRVLLRRTLPIALPKGVSEQRIALGPVEPGSIVALDEGVSIVRSTYDAGFDEESVLRRLVGRQVTVERPRPNAAPELVQVTVLGVDPLRFKFPDGTVTFGSPGGLIRYPADAVPADASLSATIQSANARNDLKLGWFTDGAAWHASYQILLGKSDARVTGSAVINAGTLDVKDADVQLLAGSVNRAAPPPAPRRLMERAKVEMTASADAGYASEQRAGEFHLYTLPGKTTLRPGTTSTIALFEPVTAAYEKRLTVRGALPWIGYIPQIPDEEQLPVQVTYTLKRAQRTAFGDLPLPGGTARIYEQDAQGRLQLVGEAGTNHTPAGKDLELDAGVAFDFTAKRVQTNYTTRRDSVAGRGIRTVATIDYAVTITNATNAAQTVDVLEERSGEWSVVSSSAPAEKLSSTRTRFKVTAPAGGEARLTYRIRAVW